ncbi:MAG: putative Polar-differentiation response regulator DivK [Promethearchaeota archaeon]|nr:MAG: putative Polar-differentiation response regulator DivK [Candidatus Lokiarchaeota archaeon]
MHKNVVIIEDKPNNSRLFEAILSKMEDVSLLKETRRDNAINFIRKVNPDLILLDNHLPEFSGSHICREIRKIQGVKKIPIIAVSPYFSLEDEKRILNAGFDECISKATSISEFRKLIKRFISLS